MEKITASITKLNPTKGSGIVSFSTWAHFDKKWKQLKNNQDTGKPHSHKIFLSNFLLTVEETSSRSRF